MRITVNLSIFFHDHRSLAKIFINKKMKCIRDVENHITDIFNIQNFYLKCDNQYLPPSENVQILNYDDIVWAVPAKSYTNSINNNSGFLYNNEVESDHAPLIAKKKKKKKEHLSEINETETSEKKAKRHEKHENHSFETVMDCEKPKHTENNEDIMEVEDIPTKPKKKKKKKKCHDNMDVPSTFDEIKNKTPECEDHSTYEPINNKEKIQSSLEEIIVEQLTPKDSGQDSLESSTSENTSPDCTNVSVKSLVHSFENGKINYANRFQQAVNTDNERRVNIVKTIIISNKSSTAEESKVNALNVEDLEIPIEQKEPNANIISDLIDENNANVHQDENCSNLDTPAGVSNGDDIHVNKRKRRRTRRRRQTSGSRGELNTTFEQPVYNFIHKPVIVQTPTHIRFNEECSLLKYNETTTQGQSPLKPNEVLKQEQTTSKPNEHLPQKQSTPEHNEVIIQERLTLNHDEIPTTKELAINNAQTLYPQNEVIVISESPGPVEQPVKSEERIKETLVADLKSTYSDKEIEECILKQPITPNAKPRVGDVIAFKILRMSEKYTPEVSSTVVGKVINYNPEDKEILFSIVYGHDQCLTPQGKFSLEPDEHSEESSQFQCCWSNLIEPRLLYP